jgi:putative transposase
MTPRSEITFDVPQVREGGFHPGALEKGLHSERALNLTLAEMYMQGVSTRKLKAVIEQLCGVSVSTFSQYRNLSSSGWILDCFYRKNVA